jgi:hypothetical protein
MQFGDRRGGGVLQSLPSLQVLYAKESKKNQIQVAILRSRLNNFGTNRNEVRTWLPDKAVNTCVTLVRIESLLGGRDGSLDDSFHLNNSRTP